MITLTPSEINQYRAVLEGDRDALMALQAIEDCDGDVEDAAIVLALQAGQEPDRSDYWLESQAKRWRVFLCQDEIREKLASGAIAEVVKSLVTDTIIPASLAVPVLIYVLKTGVDQFCRPFQA
jgi:hypothetical protein